MRHIVALLFALLVAGSGLGEDTISPDIVLVPLAIGSTEGANGSLWVTDLAIANPTDAPIDVTRDTPATCLPPCTIPSLPAHSTSYVVEPSDAATRGRLLHVEAGRAKDLSFALRVRDVSRQAETWGTVVPVVLEADLYNRAFGLTDIPVAAAFRSMLRIYDVDARTAPRVTVRIFAIKEDTYPRTPAHQDTLIADFEPNFIVPPADRESVAPAAAEVPLWLVPGLTDGMRIRVEVVPLDGAKSYWGFVSVTHNATQHVAVITPH